MGGNFGTRNSFFPEYALLPWAAGRVGRPVKWCGDRTECFVSDFHGRDLTIGAEPALDADGTFLGLRGTNLSNVGAYTVQFVPLRKGIGQALIEQCHYDRQTGQLLTASFMDYAMPRADDLPFFDCKLIEVPVTSHRLGIHPGGEGGTTPALGTVVNAVEDALSEFGVKHIAMPVTPERVWRAIRAATAA
jgi:CO/xanthine dehydrogenase Mo-binding subunit